MTNGMVVVGFSGATFTNAPNAGAIFLVLDPWEVRARKPGQSSNDIQAELFRRYAAIQEGLIIVIQPPPVPGIGNAGGFRMMVEDRAGRGPQALQAAVGAMMGRAAQTPGVQQVFSLFETATPQLYLDIDRTKAQMLGVNVTDVFAALQIYLGSAYVNDFNLFGRTFRVTAQAGDEYRNDPDDVLKIRVRNSSGDSVPLGSFTTVRNISGPYRVPRYNLYPSAELDGGAARGYSQGQAIEIMEKLAAEVLPDGFGYEWTTLAFQQLRAGNTAIFAFALAVVFVFLVLAAQYESLTLAARRHPDRADVPGRGDRRRDPARLRQQHPHPGRLRGADRARGQERDPDRRVRQAARGPAAATAGTRRSRPRGCGCGRS